MQLGKSVGLTRNEKRSVIESVDSDTEATLTTPLWDAVEYETAAAEVEYTFTSLEGKKRQHKACDDLLADITAALETVTVNAPDHRVLNDVWTARVLLLGCNLQERESERARDGERVAIACIVSFRA